ncbi:carbohydrate-binding protein [Demequina sp. NBRC 110056]|uniref:carbohydrate-binding protein n=1 Tax=Demequina sp. NBRC 110056 TaxID=1570345 RepID=UPI00117D5CD4|nr:carbohydrate-binding protein [Demequina sp. NBRC 110056]
MRLTATRLRTSLAALTAAALVAAGAVPAGAVGPAGALDANELPLGDVYVENVQVGDFTINAEAGKEVDVRGTDRTSDRGDVYAQRLELNGSGTQSNRSIAFTADGPTQVLVHARSGSSSADRALALFDASGEIARVPALADDSGVPVATEILDVPAAGDYWIASPSSGVNVFYLQLGLDEPVDRAAWDSVAAPEITGVAVDPTDPSRVLVQYDGLLGDDGGDIAAAVLRDADGAIADRAFTATDGATGTIGLTPPASGDYTVEVSLTRSGEAAALTSEPAALSGFALPLGAPEVTGALTTAVANGSATVTLEWGAVAEAETYSVETIQGGAPFEPAVADVAGTAADLTGLTPGATYQVRVVAHRGADSTAGPATVVEVATAVERWQVAEVGSNASGLGEERITVGDDGTIAFDATGSSTKIATSEDGFLYFFTEVDPENENFTLRATFEVTDDSAADNQSGFGVIAIDDVVTASSPHRYFNSAGAVVTRYYDATPEVVNGTPGARFVTGYSGSTNAPDGVRDDSASEEFDSTFRTEAGSSRKFVQGDVYDFSLRRSNTGFHAIWHREGSDDIEVIEYNPDMLLVQNEDAFYVGLAVARKIAVTVTDWEFTTIHPDDDEEAQDPPTEYVPTSLAVDVTSTSSASEIAIPLVADFHGTGQILSSAGDVLVDGLALTPGQSAEGTVALAPGANTFIARATPGPDQPQLGEFEELESLDPVDVEVVITVDSFGAPGQSLWVAPDGTPDGDGTRGNPLDLHTGVAYAQPGQQIVLVDGTYTPDRAIVVGRGHDGTEDAPITLMSEPGARAVLDLTDSEGGGIHLRGDWWHVYNLEITGAQPVSKPMLVQGHHNVVERVESHHNQDTGIQISGASTEPPSMWPSHNLVVSSESHHNADPSGNDADGFAAKLTVGEGNVFRHNIAHHNIDDGWDLYARSTTGPIGTVVIESSVAYENGFLSEDPSRTGEGNGFKLGGESQPGDHLLKDSISYGNLATGVTSNSGPDVRLDGVTTVDNGRGVRLESNAPATDYEASGVLSWRNPDSDALGLKQADTSLLASPTNYFDGATSNPADGRPVEVTAEWFVTTDFASITPEIAADGSVEMHGLYELTGVAPADVGGRLQAVEDPNVIEVLPEPAGPQAWLATAIYQRGDVVQHDGLVYEARWWTRGWAPSDSPWGPWTELGEAPAGPATAECAAPWSAGTVYRHGDVVSHDGANHRALWWTRSQEPGDSVWGPWESQGACA